MDKFPTLLSVSCTWMHSIHLLNLALQLPYEMDGVIYVNTQYSKELEIEIWTHMKLTNSAVWEPHSELIV